MPYATGFAPHIRHPESVPGIYWKVIASLIPVILVSLYFGQWFSPRLFGACVSAAILGEVSARNLFKKKTTLEDGSAILTGLLLALTLPPGFPSWIAALGSLFSILFGKEIFGGLGSNPFNPAVLGNVFLQVCFSDIWVSSRQIQGEWFLILSLCLGGVFLISWKLIFWEIPFLFLTVFFAFSLFFERSAQTFLSSGIFLTAFYLITDFSTTPLTRRGVRWFASGSGFLGALLKHGSIYPGGIYFSILMMNALTPWIDGKIKPRASAWSQSGSKTLL